MTVHALASLLLATNNPGLDTYRAASYDGIPLQQTSLDLSERDRQQVLLQTALAISPLLSTTGGPDGSDRATQFDVETPELRIAADWHDPDAQRFRLQWTALPDVTLRGARRGDGGFNFGGKVTFGARDRHSIDITRHTDAEAVIGKTVAQLALGGSMPLKLGVVCHDLGESHWHLNQDLGLLSWEVRYKPERLHFKTVLAVDRQRGNRRVALKFERVEWEGDRQEQSFSLAALTTHFVFLRGVFGFGWTPTGDIGPIVSAEVPLFGTPAVLSGSYRGIEAEGNPTEYRVQLRASFEL